MKRDKFYISTQARPSDISSLIQFCNEETVGIELSSGCSLGINAFFDIISNYELNVRFHNYFPLPEEPFVIDVASVDNRNRQLSVNFIKKNLLVSKRLGLTYYSFHAGFTTSPLPRELGGTFEKKALTSQLVKDSLDRFYTSMNELIKFSHDLGIQLLIENNVVAQNNFVDGLSVAHLSNHQEILAFFQEFNSDKVGLLLDTAHYYISENSLRDTNFFADRISELQDFTKVVHHSNTCQLQDCNRPLEENYWFKKYISNFLHCDHVLEIKNVSNDKIKSSLYVLEG